jgi:hypothetical protein
LEKGEIQKMEGRERERETSRNEKVKRETDKER